jgi:hypothetical protein
MRKELAAEGFLRHRGLILTAAGGAALEGGLLTLLAPNARSMAPQVTAVPSLAAYHDLRWLFADTQSWLWFAGLVTAVLISRAALDTLLLRLAWPRGVPAPPAARLLASCAALTMLAWVLLSPAATLAFGVAVVPFSWPFLAAFPIMLGIVAMLSHGGVLTAWWRRLPPPRAVLWLFASFAAATAAAAVITRLPTPAGLAVAALAGLFNARAWYAMALLAARVHPRPHESVPAKLVFSLPFAPIAAAMVLVLVVGAARLLFTGTIQLPVSQLPGDQVAAAAVAQAGHGSAAVPGASTKAAAVAVTGAVLVVGGFGSSCCDAANGLKAMLPGVPMRQFSYVGLDAQGKPVPSGPDADDMPLPDLGDRIAAQVRALHAATGKPVEVVAESEGTLGVYAMLARDPGVPVSSVTLLSPIVGPGQLTFPTGPDASSASEAALKELNSLVGGISPFGPSGAEDLINSVSEFGAQYFQDTVADAGAITGSGAGAPVSTADGSTVAGGTAGGSSAGGSSGSAAGPGRWLAVVPLADAVTLPYCSLPAGVIVVPALHGGLLGDPAVLPMVSAFLSGQPVSQADNGMREAAELITDAAAAWRMPDTSRACPAPSL